VDHLFNPWNTGRISSVLVVRGPAVRLNEATDHSSVTAPWHRRGLVYLNLTEPFNLYLMVALVLGLFAASPFVFYQFWLFIAPELYRSEKRYVVPFLISTVGLFLAGGLFGYKVVYPASLTS
jgi:Sec-independent protein secretion pathway component TatC